MTIYGTKYFLKEYLFDMHESEYIKINIFNPLERTLFHCALLGCVSEKHGLFCRRFRKE